ncbi:MAG: hypothetical protein IPN67_18060 [Bacteroidales bacterium]|nr:hypothetical protein [Bacteroidales bacterium]
MDLLLRYLKKHINYQYYSFYPEIFFSGFFSLSKRLESLFSFSCVAVSGISVIQGNGSGAFRFVEQTGHLNNHWSE